MNIIGLLDKPTSGTFQLNGRNAEKFSASRQARVRRDKVGFVFQSFNLLMNLTVLDNVALPLLYKGQSQTKRLKLASNLLERVGLKEREYFMPGHLSGGQMQSAAIARALVNEPPIIIADEPTGNLDSASSRLVMELLSEIHRDGTTILLVTHNPELTRYASRVVYMQDGRIVHDEATKIGQVAPTAHKVMYEPPTTTEEDDLAGVSALMKAVPSRHRRKNKRARKPGRKTAKSKAKTKAKTGRKKS
jgi:putative ABC transport system ATP-binding protein